MLKRLPDGLAERQTAVQAISERLIGISASWEKTGL